MRPRFSLVEPGMFETWSQVWRTCGAMLLFALLIGAAVYELVYW